MRGNWHFDINFVDMRYCKISIPVTPQTYPYGTERKLSRYSLFRARARARVRARSSS
jgi:hypothetical protein